MSKVIARTNAESISMSKSLRTNPVTEAPQRGLDVFPAVAAEVDNVVEALVLANLAGPKATGGKPTPPGGFHDVMTRQPCVHAHGGVGVCDGAGHWPRIGCPRCPRR